MVDYLYVCGLFSLLVWCVLLVLCASGLVLFVAAVGCFADLFGFWLCLAGFDLLLILVVVFLFGWVCFSVGVV